MVETVRYRVDQFFRALVARVPGDELEQAMRVLPLQARELFRRQARQDQRHALAVYHALRRVGSADPHLLAAALLHDVGKAAVRLPAWQRAVIVLLERFAPRLLGRLSRGEPRGWRRLYVVHARHPEVGACWAQEAGCSSPTAILIRRHHDQPAANLSCIREEDRLLAALQAADSQN